MQKAFNMVFDYWATLSPTPILPPSLYDGMKYILDISKGFIRDTGPFFLIPIILGNLSKPRNIFHTWTWVSISLWDILYRDLAFWNFGISYLDYLSKSLGLLPTWWTLASGPLFVRTFLLGLCDRTGRPSIGQRKYSSRGSPLPTRWVRAPLLDWLSICLVIYSSFAPGGAGPAESLLSSYDLSGHGAHRAFKWVGNRESIHHISFFYLGKFIYLGWNLGSSFFIIWKAYIWKSYWGTCLETCCLVASI